MKSYNDLINQFPNLFQIDRATNHSIDLFGIECDIGWFDIIYELSEKINNYCTANNLNNIYVLQIKEKFGSLRYYLSYNDSEISKMIEESENLSEITCELCGNKGEIKNISGLIKCICINCLTKFKG